MVFIVFWSIRFCPCGNNPFYPIMSESYHIKLDKVNSVFRNFYIFYSSLFFPNLTRRSSGCNFIFLRKFVYLFSKK